jgi:hypothetical protein
LKFEISEERKKSAGGITITIMIMKGTGGNRENGEEIANLRFEILVISKEKTQEPAARTPSGRDTRMRNEIRPYKRGGCQFLGRVACS